MFMESTSLLKPTRAYQINDFTPFQFFQSYVNTVLTTSYMYVFAIFNILFTAIGLAVVFVMNNFFPEIKTFTGFIYLFDTITIVTGFVYMIYLNSVLYGYTDPLDPYLDFHHRLERIAMHCRRKSLEVIHPLLLVMIDLGNNFRGRQLPEYFEFMARNDPTSKIKDKIKGMDFSESFRFVLAMMKTEFEDDVVADQETNQLFEQIQSLEKGGLIQEPSFMQNQNYILLFSWYCVWVPITLWVQVGSTVTVVLFPLLSNVLWGTGIQRLWLKNVWDDSRPFRESNHEQWPEQFKASITKICQRRSQQGP